MGINRTSRSPFLGLSDSGPACQRATKEKPTLTLFLCRQVRLSHGFTGPAPTSVARPSTQRVPDYADTQWAPNAVGRRTAYSGRWGSATGRDPGQLPVRLPVDTQSHSTFQTWDRQTTHLGGSRPSPTLYSAREVHGGRIAISFADRSDGGEDLWRPPREIPIGAKAANKDWSLTFLPFGHLEVGLWVFSAW